MTAARRNQKENVRGCLSFKCCRTADPGPNISNNVERIWQRDRDRRFVQRITDKGPVNQPAERNVTVWHTSWKKGKSNHQLVCHSVTNSFSPLAGSWRHLFIKNVLNMADDWKTQRNTDRPYWETFLWRGRHTLTSSNRLSLSSGHTTYAIQIGSQEIYTEPTNLYCIWVLLEQG